MNRIQRWLGKCTEREQHNDMESLMIFDAFGASSAAGMAVSEEGSLRDTAGHASNAAAQGAADRIPVGNAAWLRSLCRSAQNSY